MSTSSGEDLTGLLGSTVGGKYRIDAPLGRGGMGAVFQATNTLIGKRVALKFLYRDATRDRDAITRFQREAESASLAESAHIVQIFDSGTTDDGLPYLVMEYLRGEDLRTRLQRQGRLPVAEVVHIAGQVARALRSAHEAGIVHRDLKPDNVFLCERDDDPMFVKIVDFGISKIARPSPGVDTLTHQGVVLGTAFYMSPEQARAERDVDGRTDLFSLGAIMFEALAGRPPHQGNTYEAVLIDICTRDAADVRQYAPDVPSPIAQVLERALLRDRDARFPSAQALYDALFEAAPGLLKPSSTSGVGPRLASRPGRTLGSGAASDQPKPRTEPGTDGALSDTLSYTAAGTAAHPAAATARRRRLRRTVVVGLVTGLGALALSMLLLAKRNESYVGPTGGDADAVRHQAATAAADRSAALASSGDAATVGDQLRAGDSEATAAAAVPSTEPDHPEAQSSAQAPQVSVSPRPPRPTANLPPATSGHAQRSPTGIAQGLQLVTEP